MLTFRQASGVIEGATGRIIGSGYSGKGEGKNNPILQDVRAGCRLIGDEWVPVEGLTGDDWGPIPEGIYAMQTPINTTTHGPYVIWLTPGEGNSMHGRSFFGIHGDGLHDPGQASEGCIVVAHEVRQAMYDSNDHRIQVLP